MARLNWPGTETPWPIYSLLVFVTQLTQFVGNDVINDVFWRVCREMEFWSEEFEEKLIELWEKTWLFIWHIDQTKNDWPASRWLAVRCSIGSVALPIVGDSWVASVRVSIATQLNSASSWVELSCVAINGPLVLTALCLPRRQRKLISLKCQALNNTKNEPRVFNCWQNGLQPSPNW